MISDQSSTEQQRVGVWERHCFVQSSLDPLLHSTCMTPCFFVFFLSFFLATGLQLLVCASTHMQL